MKLAITTVTLPTVSAYTIGAVIAERERAHEKHKDAGHSMEQALPDDPRWLPVLVEEVGEVARAICDEDPANHLYEELIQVAAMAMAWADSIQQVELP